MHRTKNVSFFLIDPSQSGKNPKNPFAPFAPLRFKNKNQPPRRQEREEE
jgi:hypothetical protein